MFISAMLIVIAIFLISAFEGNANFVKDGVSYKTRVDGSIEYSFVDYLFEVFSAFATVGLTTGYTPYFTDGSKIVLIIFSLIITLYFKIKPTPKELAILKLIYLF